MKLRKLFLPTLTLFAGALLLGATLLPSGKANACWDGVFLDTGRVTISDLDLMDGFDVEQTRQVGRWIARIEELLPARVNLTVEFGRLEMCGAHGNDDFGCIEPDEQWRTDLPALFEMVADMVQASPDDRARARRVERRPLTVQVAATGRRSARRLVSRIHRELRDDPLFGFLEVGGFPAENDFARVIPQRTRRGSKVYRVVVGAFLDKAEARLARDRIEQLVGLDGFVRAL